MSLCRPCRRSASFIRLTLLMAFHYYFIKYHFNFVVVVVVVIIIFDSGIYYGSVSVDFFGSHRARGVVERHSRLYLSEEERKQSSIITIQYVRE